ncbi:calmodulin-like protein 4 isoform X1 [Meles meles]|uniref:calmodulin-like protein 4 isoform X1 n=2 Tax=Meles meles TaxID=9662 RepID=UPI001E69EB96|nr:calmodulin-like protein 4 isoform X1 [Meles meles]
MAKFLSQDQINEYKECFSLYDKEQRGKIKATDLMVVMRCLGASPTPGEVQRHLQIHGIGKDQGSEPLGNLPKFLTQWWNQGWDPSLLSKTDLLNTVQHSEKKDRDGELDFSTFLTIMHSQIKQEDPKKEILLAMLMTDKEKKGYIMASELRSKLMKLGEKLTHKEVDDLFKEANIEPNGKVKYDEFIHKLTIPVWDY